MCGFAGAFSLDGPLAPGLRAALGAMTDCLAHRGPDGRGFFDDGVAMLGFRRLAIIDRAGGDQPIGNEDRKRWIVFNGEIYNHRTLRLLLESKGHTFRTQSDTETILHAWEEFGPACVDRLEGMFAFAIYDAPRRELFLARDRLGKKPLFYAVLGGVLHFASELKSLRRSPLWDGTIDLEELEGYFSLGYFLAPKTVYRAVRKLEPGYWLRASGGMIETRKYWDVTRFDDDGRPEAELVEAIDHVLRDAVRSRLESEVPLGAFLSGGIDSGLVVSYMADASSTSVVTTSVGFEQAEHNELEAALLSARHFGTSHHAEVLAPRLDEVLEPLAAAFDEPFADSSAIPTYYVSKAARRHVTVALSGDGGDETFGGYADRYLLHAWEARLRSLLPGGPGRGLARFLGARWPRGSRLPRPLRLGNSLENLGRDAASAYYADLCFLKPWDARWLLGRPGTRDPRDSAVFEAVTGPYSRCASNDPVQRAIYADLKVYMPNDPLVKVDRMSMQHGLEIRCPLLDRRLVELAFRVPIATKMPSLRSKHLLRELAARRLPEGLSRLPKRGFTAPIGAWIAGPNRVRFEEDVLRATSAVSGVVDVERLRQLFDDHCAGRADHWYPLWAAWAFEHWARLDGQRADLEPAAASIVHV